MMGYLKTADAQASNRNKATTVAVLKQKFVMSTFNLKQYSGRNRTFLLPPRVVELHSLLSKRPPRAAG
jgi:hypothetical protein